MGSDASDFVSIGIAAGALLVAGLHALRDVLLAKLRDRPGHGGRPRWRSARSADGSGPAASSDPGEQGDDKHAAPATLHDQNHDGRALEDKARRRIAYLLIAMLAVYVAVLQAMVIFGVIEVEDVKEFTVILGPLVTLVTAATSFFYRGPR